MKSEKGFTLIEMLVVLFIIAVLILIAIPNVTAHFNSVETKGCKAYVKMVQGQVEAYHIDHNEYPKSVDVLIKGDYLKEENACGKKEILIKDGVVSVQ